MLLHYEVTQDTLLQQTLRNASLQVPFLSLHVAADINTGQYELGRKRQEQEQERREATGDLREISMEDTPTRVTVYLI